MSIYVLLKRALPVGALAALLMLGTGLVAQAAGSATVRDDAGFFTSAGRSRIQQAAARSGRTFLVITSRTPFPAGSKATVWHNYVQTQATDPNAVTIGIHGVPNVPASQAQKSIWVVAGRNTGLSQGAVEQGRANALGAFNSAGITAGVVQLIRNYSVGGAAASGGANAPAQPTQSAPRSGGIGLGWLLPVIIIGGLAFLLLRGLGGRRRNVAPGYGQGVGGPYNQQYGGPGYGNPGYGNQNQGGGAGRGFLGGLAGGVAGSFIGNELFGNRGGGNVNAADPNVNNDPNAGGPADTPDAQNLGGGWGGGDSGWGGDAGGGGGDSGWGGDAGGGGGGDSGGGGWS